MPDLVDQIGHGADMVIMAVRENNTNDIFDFVFQVFGVRDNVVDTGHILAGHAKSHIQYQYRIIVFEQGHIAANLPQPSQRNNP